MLLRYYQQQPQQLGSGEFCSGALFSVGLAGFITFVAFSLLFPVVCMSLHVLHGATQACWLEMVLSLVYSSLLLVLALLSSSVLQFASYEHVLTALMIDLKRSLPSECLLAYETNVCGHGDGQSSKLDLQLIQASYKGWIVGCQVQRGLVDTFGTGLPALIHSSFRKTRRLKLHCTTGNRFGSNRGDKVQL